METRTLRGGGVSVLAVIGEIDLSVVDELDGALDRAIDEADEIVVVDLSGVEYLDSCGCHSLVRGAERARGRGLDFRVSHPSGFAQRVLQLTGVSDALCLSERSSS